MPSTLTEPVNIWVSSEELPNWVEPLSYMIEADINSVWNSCAVTVPVTVKSPSNVSVVFFNLPEANDWETEVNEPDISSAICAEPDSKVGLLAILSNST